MTQSVRPFKKAFTLIELSIVLVVIGLLAGGVLVGRDLVQAAKIRLGISEVEQIRTGINTFKLKYNCLPGDCKNATLFLGQGLCNGNTESTGTCNGNGNDRLYGPVGAKYAQTIVENGREYWNAFWQLELARLFDADMTSPANTITLTFGDWIQGGFNAPRSRFNDSSAMELVYFDMSAQASNNFFDGGNSHCYLGRGQGNYLVIKNGKAENFRVCEPVFDIKTAYAIDSKLDDGEPDSGNIVSSQRWGTCAKADSGATDVATQATYDLTNTSNTPRCALAFKLN